MKVLIIKSGKFSFNPVTGPVYDCVDNTVVDLPDDYANQLLSAKWAKNMKSVKEEEKPPWKREDWDSSAPDAKQKLIDFAFDLFGEPLDKRRAVSTLIRDIKRLIKQNDR